MEQIDKRIIRSEAGVAALLFGAVSGGCTFLDPLIATSGAVWISYIVSIAKLVGLIMLMKVCMTRLKDSYEGVGRRELRSYGTWIALFSALITGICSYVSVEYVSNAFYMESLSEIWKSLAPVMDANSASILTQYENSFGLVTLCSTLFWCFIYGWVLSGILAPRICPDRMFDDDEEDDD